MASQEVHFTGERVVPGEVNQDLWNEHYSRYRYAATLAGGKRVLDVGCGTGYGTALLAESAAEAIGFDVSVEAIEYASEHYGQKATFMAGDALRFPAEDRTFDLVTAFEVIEHVVGYERLIAEAARVLADNGVFLVSTPNKLYYSETRKEAGPNPFHTHEFELEEFGAALRRSFPHVQMMAQNQQEAVVFGARGDEHGTSYVGAGPSMDTAQFFVALCSQRPLQGSAFTYVAEAGNLLREREHYIRLLQDELERAQAAHLHLLEAHERAETDLKKSNAWAMSLDQELIEARDRLTASQQDAEAKANWALDLDRQVMEKSNELAQIVAKLDETHNELVKRTEWAQAQEAQCAERTEWARAQEALCAERTEWAQKQDEVVQLQAEQIRALQDVLRERTDWALGLDKQLANARALVEERTAWAMRLDAELLDDSSIRHMLKSELSALTERAASLAGSEATLEQLSNQLREENQKLKDRLRGTSDLAERIDRLRHERELVRKSKWLRLGHLLHLGPRLGKDIPPV